MDLAFVIDANFSPSDWQCVMDLVNRTASRLNLGETQAHVADIRFTNDSELVQPLEGTYLVNFTQPRGSGRNLASAIWNTRRIIFNSKDGDRTEVPDVVVIVIGGQSDNGSLSIEAANDSKADGIRLYVVSVGENVDISELRSISSNLSSVDQLHVHLANQLVGAVLSPLVERICSFPIEGNF